jgi:hypothetical protein
MTFQSPVLQAAQEATAALDNLSRALAAIDAAYRDEEKPELVVRLSSRIAEQKLAMADLARELYAHSNLRPRGY